MFITAVEMVKLPADPFPVMYYSDELSGYSYMKIPYYKNGSLMDMVRKSFFKGISWPRDLVRTYFRKLVNQVLILH
jgi:hypothetical protein